MDFAHGYAFDMDDLFMKLDYRKRCKLNSNLCERITNDRHIKPLIKKIFSYTMLLILDDIIENNVTFLLPSYPVEAYLHLKSIRGDDFIEARKKGAFMDVDFLESNFTGNLFALDFKNKGVTKSKRAYVFGPLRAKLIDYTNKGKLYC